MLRFLVVFSLIIHVQLHAQTFLTGRTSGVLPYLEYGQGTDRLGGAKMTYLDSGILIKVIDSIKDNYKIQLSRNHVAYLPRINFMKDDSLNVQPGYLSSSWRVWGDAKYDYVSVSLPERLPYRSIQQISPSRIQVDLFGVTSNTNWITQLNTAKEIKNVWYEQVEDDVFRLFIELRHKQQWGYAIYYNKNALQVRVKRQPSSLKPRKLIVAIDAGHGGSNNGATGINSGVFEKDYTLMIAKRVEKYFHCKRVKVYMTRTEDQDLSMADRTLMLRRQDPDLLVSIHLNSSDNSSVSGVSTYYRYIGFRPLSQSILDRMLELHLNNFGNVGGFNFSLNGPTEYPNCLLEVAFLSNAEDERKILDKDFQKQVAKKLYKGIKDWLRAIH